MLTIKFWTFAKKENSTANPSSATPLANFSSSLLKDDCSIVNPIIKINTPLSTNVYQWNYCYIQEFNRYYYVNDWVWSDGVWIAELQVDVLASFATYIGQQSCYILRAYSSYDGNIPDETYPCTAAQATFQSYAVDNPFGLYNGNVTEGVYIAGIVNRNAQNGSVSYYAFNEIGFRQFCTKLYTYSSGWLNIDIAEISENLQKALINPFQYVVSCVYVPVPINWFVDNSIGTPTQNIKFGWWDINITTYARLIPYNTRYSFTRSLTIPKHPQAGTRGNYLNLSPYSYYTLRFYPYGTFDVDSEALSGWTTLDLYSDMDVCTGKGILTLAVNGKNNPIRTVESAIGVPVPTASINVDYMQLGTKSTAVSAAASAVSQLGKGSESSWWKNAVNNGKQFIENIRSGNKQAVTSGIKNTVSNIASAAMASKATVELTGQQGSFSLYDSQTLTLSGRFLPIAAEDLIHRGRPLCQIRQINTLSGFVLCADADVAIPCTDREKSAIQSYLQSGFYFDS